MDRIVDFKFPIAGANEMVRQMKLVGFQASEIGNAVDLISKMISENHIIFMSFTANMVASGLRGAINWACKCGIPKVIFTTTGAIDHDIAKSLGYYEIASFASDDVDLIEHNYHRLGNIAVSEEAYGRVGEHIKPIIEKIFDSNKPFSSCDLNYWIGLSLEGHEDSFLWQCAKRKIPVFCPAPTDGMIGLELMLACQEYHKNIELDSLMDLRKLYTIVDSYKDKTRSGIILGGGVSKHHLIASNILHDGLHSAVYFTTAQEFDGSLSGAAPREAKSWRKLKTDSKNVLVNGDVTLTASLAFAALAERNLL